MNNALQYFIAKLSQIRYCIAFIVLLFPALSHAQTRGTVEVIKDPLIDTFAARRASLGKGNAIGDETSFGYRVQIFFGSNRQAAYSAQARFMEEYPQYRTYVTYTEPNFRVQAGDFRSRLEAEKLLKELTSMFPSLFIIPGKINPPKSDTAND